ncbi:dimethylsulfonioproprionate lyase DddP [Amaricoccus sp.]|uniref:dimethylsulfonioproprionate lyase DddP n=1 Tax=Amaricoccus sp. TaxID=1872485 RepID=UPI001B4DCAB6|nr:dimethylsulfonioproprionate lyase DddP [Amaricoccus sp.]MBP7003161.1 aminopeptidase P family protein [Amaricoccus sp.]
MSPPRRIDPTRRRPDGSPDHDDRVEIGPTPLAFAEWATAGLTPPDLAAMRAFRLDRLAAEIVRRDLAGLLMFDPLNIRYATDTTNMQIWNMHNPFRACLVTPDGYMILWDYKNAPFLAEHNPLVREIRSGASFIYSLTGENTEAAARAFARDVASALRARSGTARRLAVDKIMLAGARALEAEGLVVEDGEIVTERARAVKGPDDLRAMRCALHACEAAMAEMQAAAAPGLTEDDIWAHLHAGNIRRGGEWIETRLLASGPRTNPWFQECGPRRLRDGEILAFDTDLIGPYGVCADISRTWWIGGGRPRPDMIADYRLAREQIAWNAALLAPGVTFAELHDRQFSLPEPYRKQKYSCVWHGVGLADEWPYIVYPDQRDPGAFEGVLEPGMTLCVESLISREGADFSIKLEDQALITETGVEILSRYPWDALLSGARS